MEVTSRAHKCSFGILPEREEVRSFFPLYKTLASIYMYTYYRKRRALFFFLGGEKELTVQTMGQQRYSAGGREKFCEIAS